MFTQPGNCYVHQAIWGDDEIIVGLSFAGREAMVRAVTAGLIQNGVITIAEGDNEAKLYIGPAVKVRYRIRPVGNQYYMAFIWDENSRHSIIDRETFPVYLNEMTTPVHPDWIPLIWRYAKEMELLEPLNVYNTSAKWRCLLTDTVLMKMINERIDNFKQVLVQ